MTSVTWREAEAPSMPAGINPCRNSDILADGAVLYGDWSIPRNKIDPSRDLILGMPRQFFHTCARIRQFAKIVHESGINRYHLVDISSRWTCIAHSICERASESCESLYRGKSSVFEASLCLLWRSKRVGARQKTKKHPSPFEKGVGYILVSHDQGKRDLNADIPLPD